MHMELWAENTKALMRRRGVTQERLAERIGCSQGALSHWMSGRRAIDLTTLEAIAGALGARAEQLLAGESLAERPDPQRQAQHARIIEGFDELTPENQALILSTLEALRAKR